MYFRFSVPIFGTKFGTQNWNQKKTFFQFSDVKNARKIWFRPLFLFAFGIFLTNNISAIFPMQLITFCAYFKFIVLELFFVRSQSIRVR